jgi:hypothetical protein
MLAALSSQPQLHTKVRRGVAPGFSVDKGWEARGGGRSGPLSPLNNSHSQHACVVVQGSDMSANSL